MNDADQFINKVYCELDSLSSRAFAISSALDVGMGERTIFGAQLLIMDLAVDLREFLEKALEMGVGNDN